MMIIVLIIICKISSRLIFILLTHLCRSSCPRLFLLSDFSRCYVLCYISHRTSTCITYECYHMLQIKLQERYWFKRFCILRPQIREPTSPTKPPVPLNSNLKLKMVVALNIWKNWCFVVEHIPKETKKRIGNKDIISIIFRIQAYDSIICGYFSMGLIDLKLKNKRLIVFTNLFLFLPSNF